MSRFFPVFVMLLLGACSSSDPALRSWVWEGDFILQAPGVSDGQLRISRSFTNVDGQRLLCTVLSWRMDRMDRVESWMSEDQKTTILTNAGTTVLSNRCQFLETDEGVPFAASLRVRATFRRSQDYRELIRKRLDELFVKHYGQVAAGRMKFVEEQLRATWKGELDSLPDIDLVWTFKDRRWRLAGRINRTAVEDTGTMEGRLLFPFALLKAIRPGERREAGLLLPWYSRRPVPVILQGRTGAGGLLCSVSLGTNASLLGTITVSTMLRPVALRAGEWSMTVPGTNTAPVR